MKTIAYLIIAIAIFATQSFAGPKDPLYISLTSDDAHRALMAISFGKSQLDRGHELTIFLNDKGVLVGSKVNATKYAEQQKILQYLISKGALILLCPMCKKHYGVQDADVLSGITISNPDINGKALFKDNTKTLTW